jgi:glycine cleavage system H protein
MSRPTDVRYLKSHEWARLADGTVTVGISDFAVEALNKEIVFVELPSAGRKLKEGDSFGVIESVKAASDLYAPVAGTVTDVNNDVVDDPNKVSEDPYGSGWMIRIAPDNPADVEKLLSPADYEKQVAEESH